MPLDHETISSRRHVVTIVLRVAIVILMARAIAVMCDVIYNFFVVWTWTYGVAFQTLYDLVITAAMPVVLLIFQRRIVRWVVPDVPRGICPKCGYSLKGLSNPPICPECGSDLRPHVSA